MGIENKKVIMKRVILLLLFIGFIQGCQTNKDYTQKGLSKGAPPTIQFGTTCRLNYCSDCRVNSCPIGRQELLGAPCSCGIQNGVVSRWPNNCIKPTLQAVCFREISHFKLNVADITYFAYVSLGSNRESKYRIVIDLERVFSPKDEWPEKLWCSV
jgi:hypothetical protein